MPEDTSENDPIQALIAEILDAESRGERVNREEFIHQHPEHDESIREFFANHDSIRGGRDSEDATLPPIASVIEDATEDPLAYPLLFPEPGGLRMGSPTRILVRRGVFMFILFVVAPRSVDLSPGAPNFRCVVAIVA